MPTQKIVPNPTPSTTIPRIAQLSKLSNSKETETPILSLSLSKQPCIPKPFQGKISFPPIISIPNLLFLFAHKNK